MTEESDRLARVEAKLEGFGERFDQLHEDVRDVRVEVNSLGKKLASGLAKRPTSDEVNEITNPNARLQREGSWLTSEILMKAAVGFLVFLSLMGSVVSTMLSRQATDPTVQKQMIRQLLQEAKALEKATDKP